MRNRMVMPSKKKRVIAGLWCLSVLATWSLATSGPRRTVLIEPKPDDLVVLNGCVISACNYLASVRATHRLESHFWSRVLLVRYKNHPSGHAYCVWETDGQIFGYDRTGGAFPIPVKEREAAPIATSLAGELERFLAKPMVVQTAEFIEPTTAKLHAF
jgi:hypothetical protein